MRWNLDRSCTDSGTSQALSPHDIAIPVKHLFKIVLEIGPCCIDQAGLELKAILLPQPQMLGLQACASVLGIPVQHLVQSTSTLGR